MATSNSLCAASGGNTGAPLCDLPIGALKSVFFTRTWEPSADDISSSDKLKAAMTAAMMLPNSDNNKLVVFPVMRSVTDNTGDPTVETYQDGTEEITVEPLAKYLLESKVGFCQQIALSRYNNYTGKWYFGDNTGRFYYVEKDDGGGKGLSIGTLFTDAPRPKAYTGLASAKTRIGAGNAAEFKLLRAVVMDFDPHSIVNIVDVDLKVVSTAGNVVTVTGKTRCEGQTIYAAYETPLADADAWKVTNAETGEDIPVTAVAADAGNGGWDITFTAGVTTGTKLKVNLSKPADLAALDVTGLEGVPALFTKAA